MDLNSALRKVLEENKALQQEIDQLKDQQKKGELTLLKVILDAVEEIMSKDAETTGGPKGETV